MVSELRGQCPVENMDNKPAELVEMIAGEIFNPNVAVCRLIPDRVLKMLRNAITAH